MSTLKDESVQPDEDWPYAVSREDYERRRRLFARFFASMTGRPEDVMLQMIGNDPISGLSTSLGDLGIETLPLLRTDPSSNPGGHDKGA